MKSKCFAIIGTLVLASALACTAHAENRLLSWNAVSTYTDGTPIESGTSVKYTVCWSNDPWFSAGTLRTLVSSTEATSTSFDPAAEGMCEYDTIYLSVKTVLSTGAESEYSDVLPLDTPSIEALVADPLAPTSLGITYISTSTSGSTWKLFWDPVTKDTNGGTIDGNAVRYTLYWTTDEALSLESLTALASSIAETSFEFSPEAEGMQNYKRVYFAARTVMTTGEESALSSSLSWRPSNKGPGVPGNGRIKNNKNNN